MRTIVAGGREFDDYSLLCETLNEFEEEVCKDCITVVCGKARGADTLGERWAIDRKRYIDYFPADWDTHGKAAGYIRNSEMADFSEALVAFWDGKSKGTKNMIDIALRKGLLVKVVRYGN